MDNITGNPVSDKNFLQTRLFLVDELRNHLRNHSVIIEAPRRFGKTSIIKEFQRQEEQKNEKNKEFNIIFLELEGQESITDFCFVLFKELVELFYFRKKANLVGEIFGNTWNSIAARLGKIKTPGFNLELKEKTRDYDFTEWKRKIEPLILNLSTFKGKTVIIFDEFPDMLMNFKKKTPEPLDYKNLVDSLTAWLRSLRQEQNNNSKSRFVFCGSIHLRKTMEAIGLGKRINDLEPLIVTPIDRNDSILLVELLSKEFNLKIDEEGINFIVSKITEGSLYYGQILIKALNESKEKQFSCGYIKTLYKNMLREGSHDLNHYHARFEDYLTPIEREYSELILKHLCSGTFDEKEIYDLIGNGKCTYEKYLDIASRLIFEGYITRDNKDNGKLRFVSTLLKDWWAFKKGVYDVCI